MLGGAVHVGALLGVGFSPELYHEASWRLQSRRKLVDLAQSGTYGIWRYELPAINCSSLRGIFLLESHWMSFCSSRPGESWQGTLALSSSMSPLFHIGGG